MRNSPKKLLNLYEKMEYIFAFGRNQNFTLFKANYIYKQTQETATAITKITDNEYFFVSL